MEGSGLVRCDGGHGKAPVQGDEVRELNTYKYVMACERGVGWFISDSIVAFFNNSSAWLRSRKGQTIRI